MVSKYTIIGFLAVICLHYSYGAPHKEDILATLSQKDIVEKFSEFLHDEKEMAAIAKMAAREGIPLGNGIRDARFKRQAPESRESDEMPVIPAGADGKGDGFFDRAAKFVVEVLQRFLRWINTE